jgi:hypothetical protein
MGPFYFKKNEHGIDFRYFRKCRHFENISFELRLVDYSQLYTNFHINMILGNQKISNERAA